MEGKAMVSNRPIKRLRVTEDEGDLVLDLREPLAELAALPPAGLATPAAASQYLTVEVDWRPLGSDPARRPARRHVAEAIAARLAEYAPHTPAAQSLALDAERVGRYLDGERVDRAIEVTPLPAAAQGVVIVARAAQDVFIPVPLAVPVPTAVTVAPIPALADLARAAEDYATYAVLLADQQDASLLFVTQARHERRIVASGATYPFKRNAGGSQRRYQARADERRDQFARAVADETRRALDEAGVDVLIIAGDEVITAPLDRLFHETVADRIVGTVRLDITAPVEQIIEATLPLDEEAERGREAASVAAVQAAIGAGGAGAAGAADVLAALVGGRVETLVMVDDFSARGWADYTVDIAGAGEIPAEHPTGGERGQIVPIAVADEMVRRAVLTGAAIEVVQSGVPGPTAEDGVPRQHEPPRTEAARQLDALGGVGALLRFRGNVS